MNKQLTILILLFGMLLSSCYSTKTPTRLKYYPETQSTNFTRLADYAFSIDIPGYWKYIGFDNSSRDHVFKDSTERKLYVFAGGKGRSTFNTTNLDDVSFVNAFYKWDVDWMVRNKKGSGIILQEEPGKYIVCALSMDSVSGYGLYGIKKDFGIRFSISPEGNDTIRNKAFLLKLYYSLR